MKCRLCEKESRLVRAHVIPRSFYKPLIQGPTPAKLLHTAPTAFPRRIPIGVYDESIVCAECERSFSPWDDYAHEVLCKDPVKDQLITTDGKVFAYQLAPIDYERLKLFFISMLWRASVSTQPFFEKVQTGPFEQRLKTLIITKKSGDPEEFSVFVRRLVSSHGSSLEDLMLDPHPETLEGVTFYRFYLTGLIAHIKVDLSPTPAPFDECTLKPNSPLLVLVSELESSPEMKALRVLAATARDLYKRGKLRP